MRAKAAAKQAKIMTGIIKEDYTIAMDDFSSLIVDRNKLKYTRDVLKAVPKYIQQPLLSDDGELSNFGKWKRSVDIRKDAEDEMNKIEEDRRQRRLDSSRLKKTPKYIFQKKPPPLKPEERITVPKPESRYELDIDKPLPVKVERPEQAFLDQFGSITTSVPENDGLLE